ncbi:ribosomal protein S18 [Ceratobasidium sp. AG-Ba]|nr:ribosomal protein S18 [Ceratobasidium sp. AG-Ba]
MFACLRNSRASLAQVWSLRAYSRSSPAMAGPLFGTADSAAAPAEPDDTRPSAMQGLAELVQSAAEQEQDAAALPATLLERPKPFKAGTFVSPNHLSREYRIQRIERRPKEPTMGPGRKEAQAFDAFRKLDIDPLDEYKNAVLLRSFVSEMGKIHSRAKTGLTWRSQRRVGKAIRRARAMGIIPLWNQLERRQVGRALYMSTILY